MWTSVFEEYNIPMYGGDPMDVAVGEALMEIHSDYPSNLSLYMKSSLCHNCYFKKQEFSENNPIKLTTNALWDFAFNSETEEILPAEKLNAVCMVEDVTVGQFGIYGINITQNAACNLSTMKEPVFEYGALIFAVLLYFVLFLLWKFVKLIMEKKPYRWCLPCLSSATDVKDNEENAKNEKSRLKSLDTFRGITIVLMIFVNHGGGKYWFFQHAPWDGLRIADVIFPWFMWIMGVCIPMGLKAQLSRGVSKCTIFWRIVKRSVKLFALGIILNSIGGHFQLETYRIPGVLQRLALAYLFAATISMVFSLGSICRSPRDELKKFTDLIILLPQWVVYISLIVGYLIFIYEVPAPDCPVGYFGAGGLALVVDGLPKPECIGGISRYVDIFLLGDSHIYQNPTAKFIYNSAAFDPEGILGTIPSLFQVFLGIQAGQTLVSFKQPKSRLLRWTIWGVITMVISLALSSGTLLNGPIPVNKNLWSLSFVFITTSLAFFLLALCYLLVDVLQIWNGSPYCQTGMNSILLYVGHFFTFFAFPWHFKYGNMNSHFALLFEDILGTFIWILIALYLHKKRKFYTV